MDWHVVRIIAVMLGGTGLTLAVWLAPWGQPKPVDDTQTRHLLKRLGVTGDEHLHDGLSAHAKRCRLWGIYGGAVGATTMLLASRLSAEQVA